MRLDFSLRGRPGHVDISVFPTTDPAAVGATPLALDLAACEATIDFAGRGYHALLGWIQLVRSTDNASKGERFEMDPLDILGDVEHPFGFYGVKPTLFDAPSREGRVRLDWMAHSFLAYIDGETRRHIRAVVGFSWGFTIDAGEVEVIPPSGLSAEDWDTHLPVLTSSYPRWGFVPGFSE